LLIEVKSLVEAGFACHWLRPRSKSPAAEAWSSAPVYSFAQLTDSQPPGANIGVRLGEPSRVAGHYLQVIDLDVRDDQYVSKAKAALASFVPEYAALPYVVSGSSGQSRHFYFLTERPFRSKKLAHSKEKWVDAKGKEHWAWEIELFGTGKQVVLPPSIHPTGGVYAWGREIDFEDLVYGAGPFIGEARVAAWVPNAPAGEEDDDDGMAAMVWARPKDLSAEEIDDILSALPVADYVEDRDGWVTVGAALHHQFEGTAEGLNLWNTFSIRSKKFDAKDSARVWKSFGGARRPTSMATLIKAAAAARFSADDDDDYGSDIDLSEDDDDVGTTDPQDDDLLGAEDTVEWTSLLDLSEEGAIKPTLHNVTLMMRNDIRVRGLPQYNEFTQEVVMRGKPGILKLCRKRAKKPKQLTSRIWSMDDAVSGDLWVDEHEDGVRDIFEAPKSQGGYGVKITDRDLRAATVIVASENAFHPVREYLDRQSWDGKRRLDSLFCRYLGADDTTYTRSISRLTLLGAVVRAYEPGHKFDFVAIFEGLQGKRKSTFIDTLARFWFAEIEGNFDDRKEMVEKMQGSWILELPELQGFGRHEVAIIKAFVSARVDKVRMSFGRRARNYKRQCIFIGSTNDSQYLRDDTGGRRFWPVVCRVEEIDTVTFEAEVDQVWAEAVTIYRAMRKDQPVGTLPLYITDAEAKAEALLNQEERRVINVDDELAGTIAAWLEKPMTDETGFDAIRDDLLGGAETPVLRDVVCSLEVWCEMMGRDRSSYGQIQQQHFGRALKKIPGWLPGGIVMTRYGKQRVYRRIGSSPI
jgi:predicted P-loop ATPase